MGKNFKYKYELDICKNECKVSGDANVKKIKAKKAI